MYVFGCMYSIRKVLWENSLLNEKDNYLLISIISGPNTQSRMKFKGWTHKIRLKKLKRFLPKKSLKTLEIKTFGLGSRIPAAT